MKHFGSVYKLMLIIAVVFGVVTPVQTYASSKVSATAYVNLCDPPWGAHRETSAEPGAEVSASTQYGLCKGNALANTDFHLKTHAYSQGNYLSYPTVTYAFFNSSFRISGNPQNLSIPLKFNHKLRALLYVYTEPGNWGSVALSSVHYNTYTVGGGGGAMLVSQAGIPSLIGNVPGEIQTTITPIVSIENTIKDINDDDLLTLGLKVKLDSFETNLPAAAYAIAAAISSFGLNRLNILPGTSVKVGFDTEHKVDTRFTLYKDVTSYGVVMLIVQSHAQTSLTAKARTSFSSESPNLETTLESITIPYDYEFIGNLDDLTVMFDSGLVMNVTREGAPVSDNNAPVADAGVNQELIIGDTVHLDGSGSYDVDGDPLGYCWTIISKPEGSLTELVDDTAEMTSFIPDLTGQYTVSLLVDDGSLYSETSEVAITVMSIQDAVTLNLANTENIINMLGVGVLKNENMKNTFTNKLNAVLENMMLGLYQDALGQLKNDVLKKTNGCHETGEPDNNDWIMECTGQNQVYPIVVDTVQLLQSLID